MPLFHIAGSGWGVVGLYNGGTNILLREADLVELLRLIETYEITNALLVPAILQFLLITPEAQETEFLQSPNHGLWGFANYRGSLWRAALN